MKKYLLPATFFLLLFCACDVLQEAKKAEPEPVKTVVNNTPPVEKPTLYNKYYKLNTGQSYTRTVERTYYGKQADMQAELSKYDIRKGFNIEQYNKYSKASFFETDVYEIPGDMKVKAVELFRPLLDSIFLLAENNKTFHAEILVFGYTDESPIPHNTPEYNQLLRMSKRKFFNYNEYYNALSFFRAKEVSDIISALLMNKRNSFNQFDKATIDIISEGKGIEYPDAKRSYELVDDKRKITKVYWKLFL